MNSMKTVLKFILPQKKIVTKRDKIKNTISKKSAPLTCGQDSMSASGF